MRTVGLITEYNPFHNGHLHHLQESLRCTGADASVAVMSGHFLQRGEPALVDKWVRTEMALAAGVDRGLGRCWKLVHDEDAAGEGAERGG